MAPSSRDAGQRHSRLDRRLLSFSGPELILSLWLEKHDGSTEKSKKRRILERLSVVHIDLQLLVPWMPVRVGNAFDPYYVQSVYELCTIVLL